MTWKTTLCAVVTAFGLLNAAVAVATAAPPTVEDVTTGTDPQHTMYGGTGSTEIAVGDTLRGRDNDWAGSGIYVYQWQRCWDEHGEICEDVPGATTTEYTLTAMEWGLTIRFCSQVPRFDTACSPVTWPAQAKHPDMDGDGVPDYADACDGTAATTANGCPAPVAERLTPDEGGSPIPVSPPLPPPSASVEQAANPPAIPNGFGGTRAAQLTAVINNRARTVKVRFGNKAAVTGRLVDLSGKAISDAQLQVLAKQTDPSGRFAQVATVKTDANGRFIYSAPAGTSRVVRVAYTAFANDTAVADTTDVTLLVSGAITLKAPKKVLNKHAATFEGQLRGKPIPKGGVLVDLQVWFHKKWRTFATPRTSAMGAFRYSYRFTQGAAKWRFRARIRKDSLYPYELAYSRVLGVTVTR